ncbi:HNH endonuclease [Candidatus Saccharibacteria bacterium]|nr:HNH endonuclease [Candidatus Saccharibacteria bacterium]
MWKQLEDYPNYECSIDGYIRNRKTLGVVKPVIKNGGYLSVRLSKDGKVSEKSLHRLVISTYADIPDGYHVNHINGIVTDCRLVNLESCTPTENNERRLFLRRGESVNTAKLSERQVMEIRKRKQTGERSLDLAEEYGINKSSVNKIVRGYSWKHLPVLEVDNSYWGNSKITGSLSGKELAKKYGEDYFSKIAKGTKVKKHCGSCTC